MPYNYTIYLDTGRDGTYSNGLDDISAYVETILWNYGLQTPWEKVAPRASLSIKINNASGIFSQTDTSADYYNKLTYGLLVKIVMNHDSTDTTMCVLKINQIRPIANVRLNSPEYQFQVDCIDITPRWLNEPVETPLLEDVTVDEALDSLFETNSIIYPYESAYFNIDFDSIDGTKEIYEYSAISFTDFEAGYASIPFVGDNTDRGNGTNANRYVRDLMTAEYTGIFYYCVRSESFKFLNRNHNKIAVLSPYEARASSATFDYSMFSKVSNTVYDVINVMSLNYFPRAVGASGTVVAEKGSLPVTLRAQDTKEFTLRFYDPDSKNATVGAKDVINPIVGLDLIGNRAADGTSEDWSRFIVVKSVAVTANKVTLVLFCDKVGDPVYITQFQVRGTPVIAYVQEELTVTNSTSRYTYDKREKKETLRLVATEDNANEYGTFFTNVFSDDLHVPQSITIRTAENSSSWLKTQVLERTIGDVITIASDTGNEDYMIVGESHNADTQQGWHEVTFVIRSNEAYQPFIIDESEIDSKHLILS
jgi:hypothetical protein